MTTREPDRRAERARLERIVAEADRGARAPTGAVGRLLFAVALAWSLFQIYIATPLPFVTGVLLLNDHQQRVIHLAFAMFLGFAAYPAFRSSWRAKVPWTDWALALLATASLLYILALYPEVVGRSGGVRTTGDLAVSVIGLLSLLELTRRAIGLPLVIVCGVFAFYAFAGPMMPDLISHRGASLNRFVDHLWLTTEGVFGLALGVSNAFIFLYVLFGSLLEKAGAGNYFTKLAFALLGHLRGGPAKAAVVSSAMTGVISGSAIANVVTTGTFTIPLMKRVGFSAEKAAAIEVSSSINGQLMPPVMGAAAFIMAEFIGISYFEVIKHAFLPAVISYIGLYCIVHLEAVKSKLPTIARRVDQPWFRRVAAILLGAGTVVLLSGAVYYGAQLLKLAFGAAAGAVALALIVSMYVALVWVASRYPELEVDDPRAPLLTVPDVLPTLMAGLYYLLPVAVLVWCLMVERFSPELSVSWAIASMFLIMLTQRPLMLLFRGMPGALAALRAGAAEIIGGLVAGARNMVGVALALAAAGIIVGVVSLTGLGLLMTGIVETVSGGNLALMLLFTALMCVILGMGLPTTANYIVVVSVMAHPLVTLAAQGGLVLPLIAVHLFVFYFGLISGTTPPVAVDAFAGAAVARADPLRTCVISFFYSMRTAILPFIFIFNTQLLLIGVDTVLRFVEIAAAGVIAMLTFAAATQGWFLVRNRLWETAALLLVTFTLMRPGFWLDQLYPPYEVVDPRRIVEFAQTRPSEASIRIKARGETFAGRIVERVVLLPLGPHGASGEERLAEHAGIEVRIDGEAAIIDNVAFGKPAQQWGLDFDWEILELQVPADRPDREWFYLPGLLLLGLVILAQRRRRGLEAQPARQPA